LNSDFDFDLNFQVGTSINCHKILKSLAGQAGDSENESEVIEENAPFNKMSDAYLFAFILGLTAGKKSDVGKRKNYANFIQTVAKDIDIMTLMHHLGEKEDLESKEASLKAIEGYATWGLEKLGKQRFGDGKIRISDLLDDILEEKN
jgi:hypothetical protein